MPSKQTLNKPGEFGLIDQIRKQFAGIPAEGCEGIGDDCAVIPFGPDESLVVTTDMLVSGMHFLPDVITPYALGRKSLAVNLSDIAAMGAAPFASFLSIALPGSVTTEWTDEFLRGYHAISAEFSVPLLGGDTTAAKDGIVVSVTAIGRVPVDRIKRRSGALPGDIVFISGILGDSPKGLQDILKGDMKSDFAAIHHNPKPYVHEGIWLGEQPAVHAMMDVSDGLASDLMHMLRASGVAAVIDLERIPTRVPIELAVTGGEDYVLLLTAAASRAEALAENYRRHFGEPLYPVGRIEAGEPAIRWMQNGVQIHPEWKGFTHF